jgi:hypothetical protein
VNKIESITYKLAPIQSPFPARTALNGTTNVTQVPNLVVTLPQAQAAGFSQWFQAVVQGKAVSDPGRPGLLEYLAVGSGGALFSLEFLGLALQQLVPITAAGQVPSVKAVMSYQDLRFGYSAAACV